MNRFWKWALGVVIVSFAIQFLLVDLKPVERTAANASFSELGYLKLGNNARIFSIRYGAADRASIRAHAGALSHTAGRVTAAYYYREGARAPADGITLAGTWEKAQSVLWSDAGLDGWDYVFWRYPSGESRFVDCLSESSDDLCRK